MCFSIQVKRKHKEHRSLDSIAFEDDAELEYFDVLNLLPLSNIRLGYDKAVLSKDDNFTAKTKQVHSSRHLRVLEHNEPSSASEVSPTRSSNATDEEKCKEHTVKEDNPASTDSSEKKVRDLNLSKKTDSKRRDSVKRQRRKSDESLEKNSQIISLTNKFADQRVPFSSSKTDQNHRKADVENLVTSCEEDRKVEEVEDYKSIWISDNEDHEMSRRPQVLKVVDNDVTKRRHRRSVVEIDAIVEDMPKDKISQSLTKETNERLDVSVIKSSNNANKEDEVHGKNAKVSIR